MAPVLWTLYARTVWCRQEFYQRWKKKKVKKNRGCWAAHFEKFGRLEQVARHSCAFCFLRLTAVEVSPKPESNKRKLMKRSLPWTFWCSMRWQSHMKKRKMPGWRWCFSILNMMERQSEPRIWHRQRKSNLLKVAVLNKCQSENAASLFKSIRGLGLTVSGGRSPLLWGWGEFFFSYQSFFNPNQVTSLQATFPRHNN